MTRRGLILIVILAVILGCILAVLIWGRVGAEELHHSFVPLVARTFVCPPGSVQAGAGCLIEPVLP